ncbi:branched-chain-amino-acid transaminase [Candidatus Endomicrobiellum agilis]|jgi:branched-chain amino acid aminotransferase|uniref:branched-chain-amino-acid transaminase n=1 Tax=Candidatus Endomicrobiellum agilis TaxID=3238957 RepID=UPI00284B4BCF|nr:branched-chain-amino-acid transaminase [Endomicrobium sp.]MDR3092664.1 branched-chain-amino-acid transaminase [Endomicrobium sp.]
MKIYLDGKFVEREDAKISVFDHGLLYGDGIFEGIRAYNGRIFRLKEHLDRLWASAKAINITIPVQQKDMEKAVVKTLLANELYDAYIRLVVTRGRGDLGLDPRKCTLPPSIIVITDNISLYPEELYEKGMDVITVSTRRIRQDSLSPNIKSLNYLNNIIAKMEATRAGVMEAIMLNAEGYVAECTGDNIFLMKNGILYTPPGSEGALMGITRDAVIELAKNKLKISVKEERISIYNVYTADECFLTGTAAEIIPVVTADSREIADGKPGKMTVKLIKEFKNLTRLTGTPIK